MSSGLDKSTKADTLMEFVRSLRIYIVVQMVVLILCFQGCAEGNESRNPELPSQRSTVVDVLTMLEDSAFNQYKDTAIRLRRLGSRYNDQRFTLQMDSAYNRIYIHRKGTPGFVQLNKVIREDSSLLVKEFQLSMVIMALPAPFNAFSEEFSAVAFFAEDHGVLYSAYLKDSSVQKKTLSREAIRLIIAVNGMRPQSQEEMGSGGGYLAFVGSMIEDQTQSFIVRTAIPYHVFDRSDFPEMSEERFTTLSATDSLVWMVARIVDPNLKL